jgi:hypothetical protein
MSFSLYTRRSFPRVDIKNDAWKGGYKYFTENEMRCKGVNCECGGTLLPRHSFMCMLDSIRELCGFPLIVSSGARCSSHDRFIRKKDTTGSHALLLASDLLVYGHKALDLIRAAQYCGVTGIGVFQKGRFNKRFIHLDIVESDIVRFWSY